MKNDKVLIVDDEEDISELISFNLIQAGFSTIILLSGDKVYETARKELPDLIILDVMLPGLDGHNVCRLLKANDETKHIPILMLTAKTQDSDIVRGLTIGADDYVTKPFSPSVLVARAKNLLKRNLSSDEQINEELIKKHGITLHRGKRFVQIEDVMLDLTFTEFEILNLLIKRPGWVFSRNEIVNNIRGDDYPVTDRAVDFQIVGLRKKMGSLGKLIETVRGMGYRLKE